MDSAPPRLLLLLADVLVVLHSLVVGISVAGFVAILGGRFRQRRSSGLFQWLFYACCLGQLLSLAFTGGCFLTDWEKALRGAAGQGVSYQGGFLEHYLPFLPPWAARLIQPLFLASVAGAVLQGWLELRRRRRSAGSPARGSGAAPGEPESQIG